MHIPKPIRISYDGKIILIHGSRTCANCASRDDEVGCYNGFPDDVRVCPYHLTVYEDRKNVSQTHRAPLVLVSGGHDRPDGLSAL